MSDATPEEDKARELERMYDFFHAPDVTDDVVARAVATCKAKIDEWQKTVKFLVVSKDNYAETELRSWQTHLAEFEEHKQIAHYRENGVSGCAVCDVDYEYCDFAVTKAKRLLGEE